MPTYPPSLPPPHTPPASPRRRSYLKEVIQPAYLTLSEQFEDRKAGSKPYLAKNYDDFNETFWQRGCLSLDIVGLTQDALRRKFTKTFVERQSWLVPMVRWDGTEWGGVGERAGAGVVVCFGGRERVP